MGVTATIRKNVAAVLSVGDNYAYVGPPKASWSKIQRMQYEMRRKDCREPNLRLRCLKARGCPEFSCGTAPHDVQGALCPGCGTGDIEVVED